MAALAAIEPGPARGVGPRGASTTGRWRSGWPGDVHDFAYQRQRLDLLDWGLTVAGVGHRLTAPARRPRVRRRRVLGPGDLPRAAELAARGVAAAGGAEAPAAARAMSQYACHAMFLGHTADAVERYRRCRGRCTGRPVIRSTR